MRPTNTDSAIWNQVAQQLRGYRDAQRERWGTINDNTIGKYLAGTASTAEIAEVEAAMRDYPAVKEAVELVRETL